MTAKEKAKAMVKRWKGDTQKCVALAKENIEWHLGVNSVAVKFWRDVVMELER